MGGQRFVRDRLRGPSDIKERRLLHLKFGSGVEAFSAGA